MRLVLKTSPDIVKLFQAELLSGERAVSKTMAETAVTLKQAWRAQITGAGLGTRLGNSIRSASYPKGQPSLGAAALVWSAAPKVVASHDTGPLIRSANGFWLAIPTPAAGRGPGGRRLTPGQWEQRTGLKLRFVFRRGRPGLLVAEARQNARGRAVASRSKTGRGVATVPIFVMVPQVKLRKRLDLMGAAERAADGVPAAIVKNWLEAKVT